jgi:hypothetical protein
MIASIEELKEFHLLLHNLTLSENRIIEKLKSYEESSFQLGPDKIIEGVREPINLLTCTPPKSGTTSWIRGVAVLKDYLKGISKKPEDYIPAKLFPVRLKDAFSPSQFANKPPSRFKNFPNVTKVMVQLKLENGFS